MGAIDRRHKRQAAGLIVDSARRAGRCDGSHGLVVSQRGRPAFSAPALFDALEEPGRSLAHRNRIGMLDRQIIKLRQHSLIRGQIIWVNALKSVVWHRH